MVKKIICTVCPRGCGIQADVGADGSVSSVTGHSCPRGEEYARSEAVCPMRILTSSVGISGSERRRLPIRSSIPIPLAKLMECAAAAQTAAAGLSAPVSLRQVIVKDVCGTGADMISCMDIPMQQGR